MDALVRKDAEKRVILFESLAFALIILFIWLDELADIPHLLMGGEATPPNWRESAFESAWIILLGVFIIRLTRGIFGRLRHLEGLLPLCGFCKRIRGSDGEWHQIEAFVSDRTDAEFSHGICPECAEKHYPGMDLLSGDGGKG